MKVEYGIPQAYLFLPDVNGTVTKQALTISSYANDVITLGGNITVQSIGFPVVFHVTNENKYGFGKVTSATTITLDEDSKAYFLATGVELQIAKGLGMASFEGCTITSDETNIDYRGAYAFKKATDYTEATVSVELQNVVFTSEFSSFVSGMSTSVFGDGKAISIADFDVANDKEVRPNDVSIVILKRRKEDSDLWEEFYLPRVKTGDLEVAMTKDAYMVSTYTFDASTKSTADGLVMAFNIEE